MRVLGCGEGVAGFLALKGSGAEFVGQFDAPGFAQLADEARINFAVERFEG